VALALNPQVIKTANQHYAEFKDKQAKCGHKPKGKGKKTIEYKDLDKKSKKEMRETVLAMLTDNKKAAMMVKTTCACTSEPGLAMFTILTLSVPVFNITLLPCRILPVPIQAALPHITL
jgi:hypothetical protein